MTASQLIITGISRKKIWFTCTMPAVMLEKNSILLAITSKGQVVYGGKEIGVGGVRPLVSRLCREEAMPVIIQVDQNAPAGLAVKVVDEARLADAEEINFSTELESQ